MYNKLTILLTFPELRLKIELTIFKNILRRSFKNLY